jgi:hypothetical protein
METGRLKKMRKRWLRGVLLVIATCSLVNLWSASSDSAGRLLPAFGEQALLSAHEPRGGITNIFGSTGGDSNPSVATGSDGQWIAVWHSSETQGGTLGDDWDVFVSRSTDGGNTWDDGRILNDNGSDDVGDDLSPVVATDGRGNWVVAWTSTESFGGTFGRDRDIMYCRSTDNGATWSSPAALNVNAAQDYGQDWHVRIATDGAGSWVATWVSTDSLLNRIGGDGDIFVSRSKDNAASWTHPIPLNSNAAVDKGFDGTPDIAADGHGHWTAVWSSADDLDGSIGEERDILVSRSDDAGASWTDSVALNLNAAHDERHDWSPRIAANGKGVWMTLWSSADSLGGVIGYDSDMLLARSDDDGATWTRPIPIDPGAEKDSQEDSSPSIVNDGEGNWMATWHSFSAAARYGQADSDVVVSVSQDDGLTWSAPKPVNRLADEDSVDDSHPQLATDGNGNWVVIWQTYAVSGGTTTTDQVRSGWTVQIAHGRLVESLSAK